MEVTSRLCRVTRGTPITPIPTWCCSSSSGTATTMPTQRGATNRCADANGKTVYVNWPCEQLGMKQVKVVGNPAAKNRGTADDRVVVKLNPKTDAIIWLDPKTNPMPNIPTTADVRHEFRRVNPPNAPVNKRGYGQNPEGLPGQ